MLIHPLAERLRGLGMAAMADAFLEMQTNSAAAELSREDWLGLLIDREATARDNKRLGRRLSQARLRQAAVVEDTDFVCGKLLLTNETRFSVAHQPSRRFQRGVLSLQPPSSPPAAARSATALRSGRR